MNRVNLEIERPYMRSRLVTFTLEELSWLAGLFEGEGSFYQATSGASGSPIASITMTDEDVIQRVSRLVCKSAFSFLGKSGFAGINSKRKYKVMLTGQAAISFMKLLTPFMCSRRCEQIADAIAGFTPKINFPHRSYCLLNNSSITCPLYWLAGVLEAEGYFSTSRSWGKYVYPKVEMGSTDLDVIDRVREYWSELYGVRRKVNSSQRLVKSGKRFHRICIRGQAAAQQMQDIYSILGHRRQASIRAALGDLFPDL
jgi:hypothetical protein